MYACMYVCTHKLGLTEPGVLDVSELCTCFEGMWVTFHVYIHIHTYVRVHDLLVHIHTTPRTKSCNGAQQNVKTDNKNMRNRQTNHVAAQQKAAYRMKRRDGIMVSRVAIN